MPWCSSAPAAISPTRRSSRRSTPWCGAASSTCRSSAWRNPAGRSTSSKRMRAMRLRRMDGFDEPVFDAPARPAALRRRRLPRRRDLRAAARGAGRRASGRCYYLAIPPSMFPAVVEGLGRCGCAQGRARRGREAVRPRPRVRAGARPDAAPRLPRDGDLPHRPLPRQGAGAEPALLPLRQRVPRADLEPQLRRERADHDGREVRRRGPRHASTTRSARSATSSRTTSCRSSPCLAMECPVGDGERLRPRREGARCSAPSGR